MEIIAKNSIEAWKKTLKTILDNGNDFIDRDKRVCREMLNLLLVIQSSKNIDAPINVMRNFKDFVYPNKDEIKNIIIDKGDQSGYNYSYGNRLFNYHNVKNQIDDFIIPLLKHNESSRRAIVIIYDPIIDSKKNKKLIPSLINIYFKIVKSKLNITASIRSNDFFIGWPANIYQINFLQEYVANKLNLGLGEIAIFSNSAHIFKEHFDKIKEVIAE